MSGASIREYAIKYTGRGDRGGTVVGGGNAVLSTPPHALDGLEHSAPADTARLDASTTRHGLLPKLSGDATDALRGDGTQTPTPDLVAGLVPMAQLASGTPDGMQFIRDDGTLAPPPTGAGNLDGGLPSSTYGGIAALDAGGV